MGKRFPALPKRFPIWENEKPLVQNRFPSGKARAEFTEMESHVRTRFRRLLFLVPGWDRRSRNHQTLFFIQKRKILLSENGFSDGNALADFLQQFSIEA